MSEAEQEFRDSLRRAGDVVVPVAPLDPDEIIAASGGPSLSRPRSLGSGRRGLAAAAAVVLVAGAGLGAWAWLGRDGTVPATLAPAATPAASGARVLVELYSGRENPEVDLSASAADQLYARLADREAAGELEPGEPPESGLGFAGFAVRPADTSRPALRILTDAVYLDQAGTSMRLDDPHGSFYALVYDAISPLLDDATRAALPDTDPAIPDVEATVPPQQGAVGTWVLADPEQVTSRTTSLVLRVTRLECSGGKTGDLLKPVVSLGDNEIIIRTDAVPLGGGSHNCQGNDSVEVTVTLPEPIGDRRLIDAACLEGEAVRTSFCAEGAVRWTP